ncbi:transcription elongation factor GreA [Schwartzia succinivorans]|jgi:transcription elongation factor GreA|uniref:Transcription elongation factor GreA n=1 Tax=Schwartzia succinivorans DSM 10502 TaxID=1123243 RepID=A0A1M5AWK0_9FIRM|nr:transcription elongation factor GreA [Schwartzia succinivorans]MBQ1917698.1 transcription elongation factor GreA [Schwartzia sp. (in: firmicutes)]MBE6098200.1 transcription elongation factor GreA [Schwartzia succinivorans]MBQ2048368.1 transcription elongation factor GreA [Schwartzia sp. (in: firmicutes)]MBQ3862514.1 transcription elongation factor GreA [Schwartzia sp. (in: firmicutes)]MBQ4151642.1 transcription elongation factor GreA [Schwartzia sp. (in: firmicutes)]
MADQKIMLTKDGLKNLEDELENLKTVRRKEVAERLKEAIALGDLSENSEYDDAKNEQAFIEGRIQELTVKLRNVELIPEDKKKKSVVSIGCHVIVRDLEFEEDLEYALVGSAEADPANGKISNESPVGAAILGHKVGETVAVHAPAGVLEYKIMKIKK